MHAPPGYSLIRYLAAKKEIDDHSLNRQVWDALAVMVRRLQGAQTVRTLEVGCGIGTMVDRLLERRLLRSGHYTAIDMDGDLITEAARRMSLRPGFRRMPDGEGAASRFGCGWTHELEIEFQTADLFQFAEASEFHCYDLVIAHAFLDLVDLRRALTAMRRLVRAGGFLYLTLNFDGATILEPALDPVFDEHIERTYHRTMDQRVVDGKPSGGSHTGRRLLGLLRDGDSEIVAAGSSDWVVVPVGGGYSGDEVYFLRYIVETIAQAVRGQPDIDAGKLARWRIGRLAQIERGELVYIAHQVDVLARTSRM